MINNTSFTPDWISAPGDTIEDLLEEQGWSKKEFAQRTGFTPKYINDLTKGNVTISPKTAERLALVLGSSSKFWLTRDAHYQASLEYQRSLEHARQSADWLKQIPLKFMKDQKWVRSFKDKGEQVLECLGFFGVHSVDAWHSQYAKPLVAFRASDKFDKKPGAVTAWLRKTELEAAAIECEPYNKQGLTKALPELRSLASEPNPQVFIPKLQEICSQHGVAVIFVPAPDGCPVSGVAKWLTTEKAMVALSLRHKTNDHLWFTFFHEIAHILKHSKKMTFIEGLNGLENDDELEANQFAGDHLIPPSSFKKLQALSQKGYLSKESVIEFANAINIAPGIVVGRMQKEKLLPWSYMNKLKVTYQWV